MRVDWITIFTGKRHEDKSLFAKVDTTTDYTVLHISTEENFYDKITVYMSEQDLINFKNRLVSAVDNYKRNKK